MCLSYKLYHSLYIKNFTCGRIFFFFGVLAVIYLYSWFPYLKFTIYFAGWDPAAQVWHFLTRQGDHNICILNLLSVRIICLSRISKYVALDTHPIRKVWLSLVTSWSAGFLSRYLAGLRSLTSWRAGLQHDLFWVVAGKQREGLFQGEAFRTEWDDISPSLALLRWSWGHMTT